MDRRYADESNLAKHDCVELAACRLNNRAAWADTVHHGGSALAAAIGTAAELTILVVARGEKPAIGEDNRAVPPAGGDLHHVGGAAPPEGERAAGRSAAAGAEAE